MSVQEIEKAVAALPQDDREEFAAWFAEFRRQQEAEAGAWDEQIEGDAKAGRLDKLLAHAEEQVAAGLCYEIVHGESGLQARGLQSSAGS